MVSPTIKTHRALSRTSRVRSAEWDPVCGTHQGQRSDAARKQAGHKAASDQTPLTEKVLLCRSHPHRTERASKMLKLAISHHRAAWSKVDRRIPYLFRYSTVVECSFLFTCSAESRCGRLPCKDLPLTAVE